MSRRGREAGIVCLITSPTDHYVLDSNLSLYLDQEVSFIQLLATLPKYSTKVRYLDRLKPVFLTDGLCMPHLWRPLKKIRDHTIGYSTCN